MKQFKNLRSIIWPLSLSVIIQITLLMYLQISLILFGAYLISIAVIRFESVFFYVAVC